MKTVTLASFIAFFVIAAASGFAQSPCRRSSKPDLLGIPQWAMGNRTSPPRVTSQPEPKYDDESKVKKIQGTAIIDVELDADGKVKEFRPVKSHRDGCVESECSLPPALVRNAVENVKQWEFEPACRDGHGIPTNVSVEVNFRLY